MRTRSLAPLWIGALLSALATISTTAEAASGDAIEAIRRRAIDQSGAGDWEAAKSSLFELFAADPEGPNGAFAITELKSGMEKRGDASRAIERYRTARATGEKKAVPDWSPPGGGIFQLLDRPGQLEGFLLNALKSGGLLAAQTSLLAVVVQGLGFLEEANSLLDEAETIAKKAREEEARSLRNQVGIRPLQFRFPSVYSRSGVPAYTPAALRFPAFERAIKRDGFLSLQSLAPELGKARFETHAAALLGYDSNQFDRPAGTPHSPTAPRQEGFLQTYFLQGGFRTSALRPILYGADFHTVYRVPPREDLKTLRKWTLLPSAWVSWSDGLKNEVRARYDFAFFSRWSPTLDEPRWSHGPGLAWASAWNSRFRTQILLSMEWKRDTEDQAERPGWLLRSGTRTALEFAAFYSSEARARVEPFIQVSAARDRGERVTLRRTEYALQPGTSIGFWKGARARVAPTIRMVTYTNDGSRQDIEKGVLLDSAIPLGDTPLSFLGKFSWLDRSSTDASAKRGRWDLHAGIALGIR